MKTVSGTKITKAVAQRVLDVVDQGLCEGLDDNCATEGYVPPTPGHLCVEAAVCYALGEPHHDRPSCVDVDLARFKIGLNDFTGWGSNKARANGLRELAIAQLGTKGGFHYEEFLARVRAKLCRARLCEELRDAHPLNETLARRIEEETDPSVIDDHLWDWNEYVRGEHLNVDDYSNTRGVGDFFDYLGWVGTVKDLKAVAAAAVAALEEMKTTGSKFLYLARQAKAKATPEWLKKEKAVRAAEFAENKAEDVVPL